MDSNIELSVAISILEKQIADLNIRISKNANFELEEKLKELLNIKKEIYKGNTLYIKKILNK